MDPHSRIDWAHISRDEFEEYVEALLVRLYRSDPERSATVIDGRGGDGGMDVGVYKDDKPEHIYQLKFFPEGFSGGFLKRRQQIKDSFEEALKTNPDLEDWTLVFPGNGTLPERKAVMAMRGNRAVRIHIIGRAELDELFAKHSDLLGWATRRPLVDTLRLIGQESAALVGADDLTNRVRDLAALADTRSAFWGVNITTDETGTVTQSFYAKRPDAAEREPVEITFTARFKPEHEALRIQYLQAMEFGVTKPLELPSEVIKAFRIVGPEWLTRSDTPAAVELHPGVLANPVSTEIRILTAGGATVSSLTGSITVVDQGQKGMTFEATYRGLLTMRFIVPKTGRDGRVDMSYDVSGMGATDAFAILRFLRELNSGPMQLLADGKQVFKMENPIRTDQRGGAPVDDDLFLLVDDLAYLEREYGLSLTVPQGISAKDRVTVRIARMLSEGRCVVWPDVSGLNGTLNGKVSESLTMMLSGPHAHSLSAPDWELTVLDQRIRIGTLRSYHPSVVIKDAKSITEAIKAGTAAGMKIEAVPSDGTPFRIWIAERWTDPNRRVVPEPWGIPSIKEHKGLARILKAANHALPPKIND